ncbi:aldehyde dehydrogenase [Sporosarcina thermotolerans]|uniref:Aldehyde dehydrogenase n=1 Tax=Sporosarcina thermotolerans TaxID=633404 RepID=A0AAW9A3Z8_9BACL|nr:aldehyde dehydrogenase [Sporosarcina thermotolerans]MDW0115921.1 aldehyde dehydrogenase [Sporosarcina thermotolerans]WHT46862.1 aldehyde dehydrogenase [Sporosarcina thermotolerans]
MLDVQNNIDTIIELQQSLYLTGKTKDADFRIEMLMRLRDAIKLNEDKIHEALKKDLGKSPFEAYVTEVGFVLSSISLMIKNLREWMKPEQVKTPAHLQPAKSFIVREPYGSVLIIGPFNYPFQLIMDPLVGAIAAGNCAVVKPSEATVHTTTLINELLTELYPSDFIHVVNGGIEETNALIHAPFDYIFFTGSVTVGKIVMKAAAERLTPLTLELGGKSPVIVDQTANIKIAAERIVWGKFLNNGQTCVAPDYILVHETVKDKLIKEIVNCIRDFYGEEVSASVDYGRIVNSKHFDRLSELIQKEKKNIVFGGKMDRDDLFISPTILDNVTWSNPSMEDEIFGPILPILTYQNLGGVIHRIQKLPKPLSAYLFSENTQAREYFLGNLPFGGGCINDTISHVGNIHLPFGGVGASGMNAYHGKASFDLFTHSKSILKKSTKLSVRMGFPPYGNKLSLIKRIIR